MPADGALSRVPSFAADSVPAHPDLWRGFSGTAIFEEGHNLFLGVIKTYDEQYSGRKLEATPIDLVISDPSFDRWWKERGFPSTLVEAVSTSNGPTKVASNKLDPNDVTDYLADFQSNMDRQNRFYLPLDAAEVPADPINLESLDQTLRGGYVKQVKRIIRLAADVRSRGDLVNAQLAIVDRRSKIVRNISDELLRVTEPLVLLGDPGSGKSMTLREVAKNIATREAKEPKPLLPVYVRLSSFAPRSSPTIEDVTAVVSKALPPSLNDHLQELINDRRLVIFFDGMDEMSRKRYREHVTALCDFAGRYQGRIKSIFSCRINDFTPEFRYRRDCVTAIQLCTDKVFYCKELRSR
jgi:hypothetical protein